MLIRFTRMAALVVAAAMFAACAPAHQAPEVATAHTDDFGTPVGTRPVRQGGDLVMGLSNDPDRLDPSTSSSLYMRYVMTAVCEKLYDVDLAGRIVPQLATALPDISSDGLTVTIPVRTGIKFADGTAFDAQAVQTSLERHLTMKGSQRTGEMGPVDGVELVDATHVAIKYRQPFAPITAALADRAGMIMSPAALKEKGDNFGDRPVCVGPFKFVDRVPGVSITVARDPLYYNAQNVHLDTITYKIMTDASARAASLRSGEIQVADTMSPQDIDALAKDPQLHVLQTGSLGYQGLTINIGNVDGVGKPTKQIETPLAKDPRVRMALSLSIDRNKLVHTAWKDWYESACSPISPSSPFATRTSTACPVFDPEAAKKLLTEAGVQMPYPIAMHVMNIPDQLNYARALQASAAQGGFDIRLIPTDYPTLLDMQKRGNYETLFLGWSGRIDPDANTSRMLTTGSTGNYGGFSNATLDELLSAAASSTNTAQRAALYEQAMQVIHRENPYLYTYRIRSLTVHSTKVTGIEVYADGAVRLGNAAYVTDWKG
ncbi:ABC transporter substrate-binding protein [Nocardia arthritidis]|uniref:ABC transporter substrate-binding protein n=1 Tax=Nocardia arthritidis TaxID=228602 RepID=A0A6G9YMR8_9NOCA|nr:ABC transporter substrate-binding protein [Nocardia arthritidis]QIS14498.1 ABC transporter substrate-binding protein [Nocardia arthritidis]